MSDGEKRAQQPELSEMSGARIIQIVEAAGWVAVYSKAGRREEFPVACWALREYQEDGIRYTDVIGLITVQNMVTLEHPCSEMSGDEQFEGYERD
jgi:hypothetical protein